MGYYEILMESLEYLAKSGNLISVGQMIIFCSVGTPFVKKQKNNKKIEKKERF